MPQAAKLSGLGVVFVAGLLLAGAITVGGRAAQTTTTETTVETTTAPGTTESTTVTVQQTTTRRVIVPTTTTSQERSASTTPTWVWVLLGAVALTAIGLLVAFLARRGGQRGVPGEERRRRLDGAVASWIAQDGRSTIRRRTQPSCAAATRCCSSPLTRSDMSAPGRSRNRTLGRGRVPSRLMAD
jgi:hypothetical protein